MSQHTSLLWLPDAMRAEGINVIEMDGWEEAQGSYFWTDLDSGAQSHREDPTCYMIHHTASSAATPVVRTNDGRWSVANCWVGLWRDGRLFQTGGGVPTVVFTSSGPARVSSGFGHGPTLHEVAADVRVPWNQSQSDTNLAANRWAWNVETVHVGDGSPLDDGVSHVVAVMGALLCDHYGWSPWRTIGHLSWTRRKIDPWWNGRRDIIVAIQDEVKAIMDGSSQTPEIPVTPEELREIVKEEMERALGGAPITMPDGARTGNQGIVNSILWATTHGSTIWQQIFKASESGNSDD